MTSVLKIGRTNYYSVRKGTQQYCVAEGKRLQDAEFCWQAVKDPESGKSFFISGSGVRRWHLPDIHLTEKERQEEERELRFRREQKVIEETRAAKQRAGDAALLAGEAPVPPPPTEDPAGDAEARFAARDRAAMTAVLQPGWETPDQRLPVARFVKSVLQSHATLRLLDEPKFAQLVTTLTREHCSRNPPPLNDAQRAQLKESALLAAKQRIDEERRKNEYEKLTEELKDKVRRFEAERRKMQGQIDTMLSAEEKMKEELFALRAHRQDTLLTGFKRLTRVGLINAYWERWVKHKNVVEAQLHVKARERRQIEMSDKVRDLEARVKELQEANSQLRSRIQQQQGRDVVATLLNTHGKNAMRRFYLKWRVYAETTRKEKEYFKVRQMLLDCPTCKLRSVEVERLHERLRAAVDHALQVEGQCVEVQEAMSRLTVESIARDGVVDSLQSALTDAQGVARAAQSENALLREALEERDATARQLSAELQRLHFEVERQHQPESSSVIHNNVFRPFSSETSKGSLHMSTFFSSEASITERGALNKIASRALGGAIAVEGPKSGAIDGVTERAFAPAVFRERPPNPLETVEKSKELLANLTSPVAKAPPPLSRRTENVISLRSSDAASPSRSASRSSMRSRSSSRSNSSSSSSSSSDSSSDSSRSDTSASNGTSSPRGSQQPNAVTAAPLQTARAKDARETAVPTANRCPQCHFDMELTPFCPVDGSRHFFQGFRSKAEGTAVATATSVASLDSQSTRRFAAVMSATVNHRQSGGQERGAARSGVTLPPGREYDAAAGTWTRRKEATTEDKVNDRSIVLPRNESLRSSLNLDPRDFKPHLFRSHVGVSLGEFYTDSRATAREVADYIRETQIAAAKTRTVERNSELSRFKATSMDQRMFSHDSQPEATPPVAATDDTWQQLRGKSKWDSIFSNNDPLTDMSLTEASDKVFGVFKLDELPAESRARLSGR